MKRLALIVPICVVAWFTACSRQPTKLEFLRVEADCLKSYCSSNATAAEAALLGCETYARQCQESGLNGILYDQVLFRTYGRLYLVSQHLGRSQLAEQYLQKATERHRKFSGELGRNNPPTIVMRGLIEQEVDQGLTVVWKTQRPP